MDSKDLQVLFLALPAQFEVCVDDVTVELFAVMLVKLVNQAMGDKHSVVVNDLRLSDVRTRTWVQQEHASHFRSACLNFLLASSAPMRLLESSSSFDATPAPFLSLAERAGTAASSSLESPSYRTDCIFTIRTSVLAKRKACSHSRV